MTETPWTSELHWVRPGQQDRSRKTQETLLEAAAELVAERGVEGTTIADIAGRADASVGAVYHHFSDKKAITYALFDRFCEMMEATTVQAVDPSRWTGASITDILRGYLVFVLRYSGEADGFRRAGEHLARSDEALAERFSQLRIDLDCGLTKLLLDRVDEIGHPDPAVAIGFVLDQFSSMLRSRTDGELVQTLLQDRSDETFMEAALESARVFLQLRDC